MICVEKIGQGGFSTCYQVAGDDSQILKVLNKNDRNFSRELVEEELAILQHIGAKRHLPGSRFVVGYFGSKETNSHFCIRLERCHCDLFKYR